IPKHCIPSTVTVRLDAAGRWFVSILVDEPEIKPLKPCNSKIGIDLGITSMATLSTGEKVANPRHINKLYQRLRKAQKALSRKLKGSKNRAKARLKVARIQARVQDSRQDFLHKLTTQLIRDNQVIVVEDLAVQNMVKNRKLARAISDYSWGELVRQLEYKAGWYGRKLIKIDRWFPSSQRCSHCGHMVDQLPLSVREWKCSECGTHHERDINAAQNILAAGLAVEASGASVRLDGPSR
ncbi:RNA-guided endonuclease TnpB family protein, partial [Lyngbya confervoides]